MGASILITQALQEQYSSQELIDLEKCSCHNEDEEVRHCCICDLLEERKELIRQTV